MVIATMNTGMVLPISFTRMAGMTVEIVYIRHCQGHHRRTGLRSTTVLADTLMVGD